MKKINTTALVIGGAVLLIGGLAFVLLRKPKSKKEDVSSSDLPMNDTKPETSVPFELVGFVKKPGLTSISVRQFPSLMSGTSKTLESFVTVYARPSSSKNWSEISEDNQTVLGYLPNEVLRKL